MGGPSARLVLFTVCAMGWGAGARAQTAAVPLERLLAMPVGPGSVAMLVEHAQQPAARERLAAAIADSDPRTRAAAARVVFVQGARDLRPLILKALETETDRGAGRELLVAAAGLAPDQDLAALVSASRRLGGNSLRVLVAQWGRSLGARTTSIVPALHEQALDKWHWAGLLRGATAGGRKGLRDWGVLALVNGAELWSAVLELHRERNQPVGAESLAAGLAAADPAVQSATLWHIALANRPRQAPDRTLAAALGGLTLAAASSAEATQELAARHILARRALGARPLGEPVLREYLARMTFRPEKGVIPPEPWPIRDLLTKDEARTAGPLATKRTREQPADSLDAPGGKDRPSGVRTLAGFPAGFISSVAAAAGCAFSRTAALVGGSVAFRSDGGPAQVSIPPGAPQDACGSALRTLLATGIVPFEYDVWTDGFQIIVASFRPDHVACADESPDGFGDAEVAGTADSGRLEPPRLLRRRAPQYPDGAVLERISGRVQIDSLLTPSGCMAQAALTQGVDPRLDMAALQAILDWTYEPARRNGIPIPSWHTITVTFDLRAR